MPTPWESWPLRLASTRLSATRRASSAVLPAACTMAAQRVRRSCAVKILAMALHHRADLPGHEFILSIAVLLALGLFTRGSGQHQLEDAPAHLLDRNLAVDDFAAVDVHVLFLSFPERRV